MFIFLTPEQVNLIKYVLKRENDDIDGVIKETDDVPIRLRDMAVKMIQKNNEIIKAIERSVSMDKYDWIIRSDADYTHTEDGHLYYLKPAAQLYNEPPVELWACPLLEDSIPDYRNEGSIIDDNFQELRDRITKILLNKINRIQEFRESRTKAKQEEEVKAADKDT